MKTLLSLIAVLALPIAGLAADLQLHPLFTDHAVFQQQMPVPVWGTAKSGSSVTVAFAGQSAKAQAGSDGKWLAILPPLNASADPQALTATSGSETITVNDILIGEVWVGSGQSNMAWTVQRTNDADAMMEEANKDRFKKIRLFKVPVAGEDTPQDTVNATWKLPTAENVAAFSATAFYFARKLSADRNIPVGIIQSANGGTNAFSWINSDTLKNDPVAENIRAYWAETVEAHPEAMKKFEAARAAWKEKEKEAKESGKELTGRAPREPLGPDHVKRPSGHYNAMVAPLQPYAIRGVIWYQGEANSRLPFYPNYKNLMLALAEDWRTDWAAASGDQVERENFPFYLVQLPNFAGGDAEGWPRIREQMLHFWQEGDNTGMVVTIDKGDPKDIHPQDKKPVGERLASFARAQVYGENIVYSGPIYDSLRIEGNKAILTFQNSGGGLVSLDSEPLRHFQIAGADGKFVEAEATITDGTVVVSSESITEPRAVRYAWSSNPEKVNFFNKEGFPASPFRTDSWE